MREDDRVFKPITVENDGLNCLTCGGSLPVGRLAYWSQGGYLWHLSCSAPEMPRYELTEEEADARLEAWVNKNVERSERRRKDGPVVAGAVGVSTRTPESHPAQASTTVPAALTSDPRHEGSF